MTVPNLVNRTDSRRQIDPTGTEETLDDRKSITFALVGLSPALHANHRRSAVHYLLCFPSNLRNGYSRKGKESNELSRAKGGTALLYV